MEIQHRCSYCSAGFKTESRFLKHKCSAMVREEDFKSTLGQAAWDFYKLWMLKKYYSPSNAGDTFKKSRFFNTFFKFAKFVRKTQMPDTTVYIELMIRRKIDPQLWTKDEAYRKYLEYYTRQIPTKDMARTTIKTLYGIADALEVDIDKIFDSLAPNDVIGLLYQRRLSPWFLLNSRGFSNFFINKTTPEERIVMENIINPEYWSKRFEQNPADVKVVKMYVTEMGL